ncbi:RNA polymerase sigma factor [Thiobacter aerophilum]|uniref:Sigma-70 family RNA polymerase sigma factor n=1 Tax=Thiobacter aerophilum TaxID=3121275 RepID=A0ABV0EJS4_9BURK
MDDGNLIARCAGGDTQALRALHACHARAAFAFAFRMLGNEADAEEAVSEGFYEVWRQADRFAGRSSVRTWILGIVRHKALDLLRARGARLEDPLDDEDAAFVTDPGETPYEWLVERQRLEIVTECMDALPVAQKESLHLALIEGMTLAEIAQVQGVPANTVATRIHHAKRKLKDCVAAALGLKNSALERDSST